MLKIISILILLSSSSFADLKFYWTGVAGIYVTDGKNGIYFDPVFHRPSILDVLFNKPLVIDEKKVEFYLNKMGKNIPVNAVFVSHSHHDHASDVGAVAKMKGSVVHGTITTKYLAKAFDVSDWKIKLIKHGDKYKFGDFEVEVVQSKHGKIMGLVEFQYGELERPTKRPIPIRDFRMGDAFSYLLTYKKKKYLLQQGSRFTHQLKERIKGEEFEVVFQGLGNRRSTKDLMENIWDLAKVKTIFPLHHDNFFAPLRDDLKVEYLFNIDFDEFKEQMNKNKDKYQVIFPEYFKPYEL